MDRNPIVLLLIKVLKETLQSYTSQCNYSEVHAVKAMKPWKNRDINQGLYFAFALHYFRRSTQEEKKCKPVS